MSNVNLANDPFLTHVPERDYAMATQSYGAAQNAGAGGTYKARPKTPVQLVVEVSALPWLIFVLIISSFSFIYHLSPGFCCFAVVLGLGAALFVGTHAHDHLRGRHGLFDWLPMGMCLFAVLTGTMGGLYIYSYHMQEYYLATSNRSYTNVLPSEPAASHADAGIIVFSDSSRVDTTKAVGYMERQTYCVAPIMDEGQNPKVGYWAVGIDCCGARATFWCDDVMYKDARAGVVTVPFTTRIQDLLFEDGVFKSRREYYKDAMRQAAAIYDLVPDEEPVFVRWVRSPGFFRAGQFWYGFMVFLFSGAGFLLLALVIGALTNHLASSGPPRRPPAGSPMATRN